MISDVVRLFTIKTEMPPVPWDPKASLKPQRIYLIRGYLKTPARSFKFINLRTSIPSSLGLFKPYIFNTRTYMLRLADISKSYFQSSQHNVYNMNNGNNNF